MRGLKKVILLFVGVCVMMLFAGCTSPDRVENNLQMDKNGKGTFSTKFTLSKAYFEQSKYGMLKSMEEYVAIVEKATPASLGIKYEVDSKSSNEYSYVTTSFEFDSVKDFNKKATAIFNETDRLYKKNEKFTFIDADKTYVNATTTDIINNTLLLSLQKENISMNITDKEFTDLRNAMLQSNDKFNDVFAPRCGESGERVLMESYNKKDGEYIYAYSPMWSFMETYMYNLVFDNKDMMINTNLLTTDIGQALDKSVSEFFASVCLNEEFKNCIKEGMISSPNDKSVLVSNVSDLFKGKGSNSTGAKIKPYSYDDFKKCLNAINNNLLERKIVEQYELNVQYGDKVIKNLENYTKECNRIETDSRFFKISDEKSTTDKLDDSPKTGDTYSMNILVSVVIVAILLFGVCMLLWKQYNEEAIK